jgi:hypothetical protein
MQRPSPDPAPRPSRGLILWLAVGFGLLIGLLAGLGVVFHDGKSWMEGGLVGFGFFAFGFALMYLRYARKIAELLSLIR